MNQSTDVKTYAIGVLSVIIIFLLIFKGCHKENIKPLIKIKKEIVKQIEYREGEVKVVKEIDTKYKILYKTKYDTIYAQAPDTCKEYLKEFKLVADSALKIKDLVIIKQDSVIVDLKRVAKVDSLIINGYKDQTRQLRRERRNATIITSAMILLTFIGFTF